MKKAVKVALLLMVVLTVIYSSVVVYANTNGNANSHDYPYPPYVVYAAYEYKKPPSKWYTQKNWE